MRRLPQRRPRICGPAMRLVTLPGVFRPRSDSWMLARHLCAEIRPGARVLDLCTGSGAIAVSAALAGAGTVTAGGGSRRAGATTGLHAPLDGGRGGGGRGRPFEPPAPRRLVADAP